MYSACVYFKEKPTHQRNIGHGVDYDSLVLGRVVRDSTQAGFQNMISVQKRLLRTGLHPDLELHKKSVFLHVAILGGSPRVCCGTW